MNRLHRYANVQVAVGFASILVGILLVVGPGTTFFEAYESTIANAFWSSEKFPEGTDRVTHWLLATCGAGVVGWGVAWAAISHIPLRSGERWAWYTLLISLSAWGLLDLGVAIWFGVTGEVVFVSLAVMIAMVPLFMSRHLYS